MRIGVINSSWIAADPHHRLDARFWLSVTERMEKLGIDRAKATIEDVKRCIAENDAEKAALLATAEAKEAEGKALMDEARALKQQAETVRPK